MKNSSKEQFYFRCLGWMFTVLFNILWTWIFSNYGVKTLDAKGLLDVISTANEGCVDVSGNNEAISFCRKCGAKLDSDSRFCCKCGTEIKEEV